MSGPLHLLAETVLQAGLSRTSEPPVAPDSGEARRWAVEELSKPVYRAAEPSWLDSLWQQFAEWLRSLNSGDPGMDSGIAMPIIGVAAAVLIAVAIILVRPRLNARRKPARDVFDATPSLTQADYRGRAAAAAARSDWRTAVVEQFRAIVRSAEERAVLDPQPGRTADEVAAQLGRAFGRHAAELGRAAGLFDAIRYGRAGATGRDHADMARLDEALGSLQPDYSNGSADRLARPV
jgi:hypothetical protein